MIREATKDDILGIVAMARAMHAASRLEFMPFSEERFTRHLEHCMAAGFLSVGILEHRYVGFMMGIIGPSFYSECLQAVEMILFVVPEERGSSMAADLSDAFAAWGKAIGAVEATAGSGAGMESARVRRFYERQGFTHVGDLFARRL